MSSEFGQMSEPDRRKWRAALKRKTEHARAVPYVDPAVESVYEFRPDLDATVEHAPDGSSFVVAFQNGELTRQATLKEPATAVNAAASGATSAKAKVVSFPAKRTAKGLISPRATTQKRRQR
jgi:hypothetical protein